MSETAAPVKLFATLFLFWLLLSGSLAIDSVAVGVLIAGLVAVLLGGNLSYLSGYRLTPASFVATLGFIGYFLMELVKANLAMATLVLTPDLPVRPAIVRVHTGLKKSDRSPAAGQFHHAHPRHAVRRDEGRVALHPLGRRRGHRSRRGHACHRRRLRTLSGGHVWLICC